MINVGISSVLWGCSVPWGDSMMHVGKYHEYHGGYVGDIMSTVGCSVPWGTQITKDFPHGTEHPHGT